MRLQIVYASLMVKNNAEFQIFSDGNITNKYCFLIGFRQQKRT